MQCLILAGGLGTRIRSYTKRVPKALVPVAGRPFADHQLGWLAAEGVRSIVYSIGYNGEMIRGFVGDGSRWGLRVTYVDEGADLLGTGGAVRKAVEDGAVGPKFLVLYGDSYLRVTVRKVWRAFEGSGAPALITVYPNHNRFGRSNVAMRGGELELYDKASPRPDMTHIDYGLGGLSAAVAKEMVPSGTVWDLSDVLHRLSAQRRLAAYIATNRFYEIGSPEGRDALEAFILGRTRHAHARRPPDLGAIV